MIFIKNLPHLSSHSKAENNESVLLLSGIYHPKDMLQYKTTLQKYYWAHMKDTEDELIQSTKNYKTSVFSENSSFDLCCL